MRRFTFPLQRLLWHRGLQESLAQQGLGRALQRERAVQEALAQVDAQAREGAARLAASIRRPVSGGEVALHAGFATALAARRDRLSRQAAEAAVEVAERRALLRERWRGREAVAQLRRQALAHHRASVEREEQITLDEVAAVRHGWAGPGPTA